MTLLKENIRMGEGREKGKWKLLVANIVQVQDLYDNVLHDVSDCIHSKTQVYSDDTNRFESGEYTT